MDVQALTHFLQAAIRCQSLTGYEEYFIKLVCQEMGSLGFDRVWVDPAGSAIGEIRGSQPGKSLLLDAHADTVKANPADWHYDPFAGIIDSGRLYGRGTADTKGNLAAMIYAAAAVDRKSIAGSIYISASVHEENFEGGSLKLIIDSVQPDYVIIGEATDLNLNRGGRGRAEILVETIGQSAHSSSPEVGICAVHQMMDLVRNIENQPVAQDPILGPASLVLTDIVSDPYPGHSVIPNRCRVTFDRRSVMGETEQSVLAQLTDVTNNSKFKADACIVEASETTYTGYVLKGKKFFPAWLLSHDHPLVEKSFQALKNLHADTKIGSFRFCTNATYCAGRMNIPTIGFGLGSESDAHTVDESIKLADLEMAAIGYQAIIKQILS